MPEERQCAALGWRGPKQNHGPGRLGKRNGGGQWDGFGVSTFNPGRNSGENWEKRMKRKRILELAWTFGSKL